MSNKSIFQLMETKSNYISPIIEFIRLDNEISLALESTPPFGPEELTQITSPENLTNDFFKSTIV